MSDNYGGHHQLNDAMLGLAMVANLEATRQAAEYQRQQLNLLREHQGKPPIPPPYRHRYSLLVWVIFVIGGSISIGIGAYIGFLAHLLVNHHVAVGWAVGVPISYWLFCHVFVNRPNNWLMRRDDQYEHAYLHRFYARHGWDYDPNSDYVTRR